jgi:DNA-binding transcriptional LysR family regulator
LNAGYTGIPANLRKAVPAPGRVRRRSSRFLRHEIQTRGEDMSATSIHDERLTIGPHAEFKTAVRRRSRCTASTSLNLNALHVFARVAEANSFSEGARRLRIPVSTVSRQVAELEAQLGVRLLERSTRSLKLTSIGTEILEEARAAVDIRESILGLISSQLSSVSGLLRILVPPSIASWLVMPVVGAFRTLYPDVRVQVTVSDHATNLAGGDFDLLVKTGPMKDSSRICRRILTFRDRLLASPAYLKTCKAPETPKELLGHRLLAFSHCQSEIAWTFINNNDMKEVTLNIEPDLSVNDPTSLAEALLAGMGIGNLPSMASGEFVQKGRLVELMPQWRFGTLDVLIVHASNRHVRRPVQEFTRFAAKLAPALFPPCQGVDRTKHQPADVAAFGTLAIV